LVSNEAIHVFAFRVHLAEGQFLPFDVQNAEGPSVADKTLGKGLPGLLLLPWLRIVAVGSTGAREDVDDALGLGFRSPIEGVVEGEIPLSHHPSWRHLDVLRLSAGV